MILGITKFETILFLSILLVLSVLIHSGLENEKEKNKTLCTSCQEKQQNREEPLGNDGGTRQEKSGE